MILIATPSFLLPGVSSDAGQVVALIGICAALLTVFEYSSAYPCLFEFRDAPPFNRIRFISLFFTVLLLSLVARGQTDPTTVTDLIETIGMLIGQAIDFPYSPVRLVVLMLPEDTAAHQILLVRSAAGLAYLISLLSMAVFWIVLRVQGWPLRDGNFNVWVNLPTFDPTGGGDVVKRLNRDSRVNVALGFILPFLMPAAINAAASLFGAMSLENPQTMIWTVAAWAFLPASLFMRGIAMGRIAAMVRESRRTAPGVAGALSPA